MDIKTILIINKPLPDNQMAYLDTRFEHFIEIQSSKHAFSCCKKAESNDEPNKKYSGNFIN